MKPPLTPGVVGADDRRIAADRPELRAIGRLNHGGGFCTATLIAPDRVLTAAHCLFFSRTGRAVPAERMHFLAGYRKGAYAAHRRGARAILHWDYQPPRPTGLNAMAADVAILVLDSPIDDVEPIPFAFPPGDLSDLISVSYARDRSELPSIQSGCGATAQRGPLLFTDCDVNFGGSGGPLLQSTPDGLRVSAVVSGAVRARGAVRSIGVRPPLDLIEER
ncbi:MAG: trypsin-like peptidase domain-containing protein [Pseudomonadota bacterium]